MMGSAQVQQIADDLSWYWTWAEGERSAPSNYIAMISAIRLGRATNGASCTGMDEGRLAVAP